MPKNNEQIQFGLYANPNYSKDPSKQPAFFVWMKDIDGNFIDTKGSIGALWMRKGDDCPESKQSAAYDFISKLQTAIGRKWIKISGNLEVQELYKALGSVGPPHEGDDGTSFPPPEEEDPF